MEAITHEVVLDPFGGSGTTAAVALRLGRAFVMCELNPEYLPLMQERLDKVVVAELPAEMQMQETVEAIA